MPGDCELLMINVSTPTPSVIMSAPAPPLRVSFPVPPMSTSFPSLALMVLLLPSRPMRISPKPVPVSIVRFERSIVTSPSSVNVTLPEACVTELAPSEK